MISRCGAVIALGMRNWRDVAVSRPKACDLFARVQRVPAMRVFSHLFAHGHAQCCRAAERS
jgi:hypothetical protein